MGGTIQILALPEVCPPPMKLQSCWEGSRTRSAGMCEDLFDPKMTHERLDLTTVDALLAFGARI